MGPYGTDATAAMSEKPEAQISTLLCLFLKQELRKLGDQGSLRGKAVLQIHCALVAGHALQQHFQHPTQNALLGFCYRNSLNDDL